ncbi:S-layer homology domain-containing protein [Candidatus Peribacteria bacterium]|nr:MAG: S-layer homology domain-containing protein [Candidatus Peribacteria bacterium]
MNLSRLVLAAGTLGMLYAPAASAKFLSDFVPSTTYVTPEAVEDMTLPSGVTAETKMTRASFTAMVIEHLYSDIEIENCYWDIAPTLPPTFTLLYTDVSVNASYAKQLCIALRDGIARGYKDGSYRPNNEITFAEASKIIARAYGLTPYAEATNRGAWYGPYAFALAERNTIPVSVSTLQHIVTADEAMEMLERLDNDITTRPGTPYKQLDARVVPLNVLLQMNRPTKALVLPPTKTTPSSAASSSSMPSSVGSTSSDTTLPWYKLF